MEDFLKSVGIDKEGKLRDGEYVVQAENLLELSKWYTILTQSDDLEEDFNTSKVSANEVDIHMLGEMYDIALYGDMDNDEYTLVVTDAE